MSYKPNLSSPTFEHHSDGFGIGHARPRISWRFSSDIEEYKDWMQYAYDAEIVRGSAPTELYHVESSESVLVPWPGQSLQSREAASVRVRSYGKGRNAIATDVNLDMTEWSPWASVESSLLKKTDWVAAFITSAEKFQEAEKPLRPIRFRKGFSLPVATAVAKARLYITSLGVYEAYINGSRVGHEAMAPGWTSYQHRLHFQTFDLTSLLREDNVVSAEVGEGWYAGRLSVRGGKRYIWGSEVALLAQLEITLTNGEVRIVASDDTWKSSPSAILTGEIYDGEEYDGRQEQPGWNTTEFDECFWIGVKALPFTEAKLIAPDAPPVRVTEELTPVDIIKSPSGKSIIDFGQNLVGVVRVRSIPPNTELSLQHAEVLEHGELATKPLREARSRDIVHSADREIRDWSPKFTFHGFRYVEVDGLTSTPKKEDFTALVLHSDMRRRGWFSCSDDLVNQLHKNVVWGMRGNFLSLPTDCPQRDERLGWTGDAQLFCPTATFLYDTLGMLSNWLEDIAAEQLAKGNGIPGSAVPDVLPKTWQDTPQAVWHDATVLIPWDLYRFSQDVELLRRQYTSMKAWLDQGIQRGPDGLWDPNLWQLGDWLDPAAPGEDPGLGRTDGIYVADAYLVHVTAIFSSICSALGLAEATSYASDAARLKNTFQAKYITTYGLLVNYTQTAVSIAVSFGLYPGSAAAAAAESLSRLVRKSKFRISTGLAGTAVICHALTTTGQTELAYRMLLEKECPSWLYPVTMGATTIWERWDSMYPDGTVNPDWMTSFNHYALGSVASWLHSTVGGISSDNGWKDIIVRPEPGGTITSSEVQFDGPYGLVKSSWRIEGEIFTLDLTIPPNSRAGVVLPVKESHKQSSPTKPIQIGSGNYSFQTAYKGEKWPPKPILPFFRPEGFSWTARMTDES